MFYKVFKRCDELGFEELACRVDEGLLVLDTRATVDTVLESLGLGVVGLDDCDIIVSTNGHRLWVYLVTPDQIPKRLDAAIYIKTALHPEGVIDFDGSLYFPRTLIGKENQYMLWLMLKGVIGELALDLVESVSDSTSESPQPTAH